MKHIFIFVGILFSFAACRTNQKTMVDILKESWIDYKNANIPDSLFRYFPVYQDAIEDKLDPIFYSTNAMTQEYPAPVSIDKFTPMRVLEVYEAKDSAAYYMHRHYLSERAIDSAIVGKCNDYLVISSQDSLLAYYTPTELIRIFNTKQGLPVTFIFNKVPDLLKAGVFDGSSLCGLFPHTELFFMQAGNAYLIPDRISRYDWDLLPENIRHGYSCGVAFNDEKKYIYYWAMTW